MGLGALVADANGRTRSERCGLPPTWLSATACGLEYARSRLSGQETGDTCQPSTLWLWHSLLAVDIICITWDSLLVNVHWSASNRKIAGREQSSAVA